MKWQIPSKTFLLGEYSAIYQRSAILLVTSPLFEVSLTTLAPETELLSPAQRYWRFHNTTEHIKLNDPYDGVGGMGASSAFFLGAYCAKNIKFNKEHLLKEYFTFAWNGKGLKPSGYDILAQTSNNCVYINQKQNVLKSFPWPFKDITFSLFHTGRKLATHEHLKETKSLDNSDIETLNNIVLKALHAFKKSESQGIIEAVNKYANMLDKFDLVASHTQELIKQFTNHEDILAIKGCGALGADVILILHYPENTKFVNFLTDLGLKQLNVKLHSDVNLFEKNFYKTLEFICE